MGVLVRKSWPQSASVISILMGGGLIRKSEGLWHEGEGMHHGFGPEELFHGRDEHDYDDSEAPGTKPHHTPYGYNPRTGELEFNEDGTPAGHHAIDAVMADLARKYASVGWNNIEPRAITQMAIQLFNEEHKNPDGSPGPHTLPGLDSVLWRRIFGGPYQKGLTAREMQTRGVDPDDTGISPKPMQTMNLNMGNVNRRGAATGRWFDSGFMPIHAQLKQIHEVLNKQQAERGYAPLDEGTLKSMEYLHKPHVSARKMSGGVVRAMRGGEGRHLLETGRTPSEQSDDPNANISSWSAAAGGLPQAFISTRKNPDGSFKSRSGRKGTMDEETGEHTGGMRGKAISAFRDAGLSLSEDELDHFLAMPLANLLFGQAETNRGSLFTIMQGLLGEHGINRKDEETGEFTPEWQKHYSSLNSTGRLPKELHATKGSHRYARDLVTLMRVGKEQGKDIGDSAFMLDGYDSRVEDHELARKILTHMVGHHGIDAHNYETEHESSIGHPMDGSHHELPEHYRNYAAMHSGEMHPSTHMHQPTVSQEELPPPAPSSFQMREAPRSEPPRYATAPELAQRRAIHEQLGSQDLRGQRLPVPQYAAELAALPAHDPSRYQGGVIGQGPLTQARMQAATAPGQTFFSPDQQWLRSRDDVLDAMDSVLKAMEDLQLNQALEDTTVMKHVPTQLDVSSPTEIGMFAKSLGLTGHDIRAIHSAQGDWSKVAKQWSVNENTVRVIKATMRRSFS